ncbi:MAG TPA: hypothetical protein VJ546_03650 [Bacillales bacterium]|nr:hypothetical protein [Bacillales bacterium]
MVQIIPPKGEFIIFNEEADYEEKGREWGLFNKTVKREFLYKEREELQTVTIAGYEIHGSHNTLVVRFSNGALSCIHPAYLKEMQSPTFGKTEFQEIEMPEMEAAPVEEKPKKAEKVKKETKNETKKETKIKVVLPVEKVKGTAVIKGFATKYNPFTESDDEVVLFENTILQLEEPLELGNSWCSYSKTLKKQELTEGMNIQFEAKLAAKKFDKETLYKVNNPKISSLAQ